MTLLQKEWVSDFYFSSFFLLKRLFLVAYKNEQIQAGNSSSKTRNKMENFPKHVCIAETKTEGNPDILSDPNIVLQKKPTVASAIFGPPTSAKKKPKGTPGRKSKGGFTVFKIFQ